MGKVIRIIITAIWLICFGPVFFLFEIFTEDSVRYEYNDPEAAMVQELESAWEVTFPEDLKIKQITKSFASFSPEENVEVRVYTNYDEEQWEQLLGDNWKKNIGYSTVSLTYHKKNLSFDENLKGYISFSVPSKLLFTDYNYLNSDYKNKTSWYLQLGILTAIYCLIPILVWLPCFVGDKGQSGEAFEIPDWVKEAEGEEAAQS